MWHSCARDHAPKAPRSVWVQYAECSGHFQYTLRIIKEPIRKQEIKLECMNSFQFLLSFQYIYDVITLYEDQIIQLGSPVEEDIWQKIIAERVKADDAKKAAQVKYWRQTWWGGPIFLWISALIQMKCVLSKSAILDFDPCTN